MSKKFVVPSVFTAVDKFSGPVNKMSRNAESSMARMERKFRKVGDTAFSVSRKSAMVGAAILTPLVLATREAVKFESAMAGVAKVANVDIGSDKFKELGDQAKALGVTLGIDAKEAAGLMANLAQGGVAIEDLDRVAKLAGKMGVAFDMTGDIAGEAFIKTKNALGGTIEETQAVMDTVNMLSNTFAASASEIVTYMANSGSGIARAVGASGSELAAFGAQFISIGKTAEVSATLMKTFTRKVLQTKSLRKVYDSVGGGAAGMLAVIEKGTKMASKEQDMYFSQFGERAIDIQTLATNFGDLTKKVDASRNSMENAGSVQSEFENITDTAGFKLEKMKSRLMSMAISLGDALIPMISAAVEKVTPLIESFSTWMSENRSSVKTFMKVAAAVGGLALAVSLVSGVVGVATKAFAIYKYGVLAFNYVAKAARIAQLAWNAAMMANPIGLFIGVAVAATAAVVALSGAFSSQTREQRLNNEVQERALANSIDQRVEVNLLFNKLRKLTPESDAYAKTLSKIEAIQPGITKQFNLQTGAIDAQNKAREAMIENIMKEAKARATAELIQEKVKTAMQAETRDLSTMESIGALLSGVLLGNQNAEQEFRLKEKFGALKDAETLSAQQFEAETNPEDRAANPQKTQTIASSQMINRATKENIELTVTDEFRNLFSLNRKGQTSTNMAMPAVPPTN